MKSGRRRNDNRIERLLIKHLPIIGEDFDAGILVQDAAQIARAVANSDQLGRRMRVDNRKMGKSHLAEPYQTNIDHGGLPKIVDSLNRPKTLGPA